MTRVSRQAVEKIKENNAKLNSCSGHFFLDNKFDDEGRLVCQHCGGAMKLEEIETYIAGYVVTGGNPEDIYPGYGVQLAAE